MSTKTESYIPVIINGKSHSVAAEILYDMEAIADRLSTKLTQKDHVNLLANKDKLNVEISWGKNSNHRGSHLANFLTFAFIAIRSEGTKKKKITTELSSGEIGSIYSRDHEQLAVKILRRVVLDKCNSLFVSNIKKKLTQKK